MRSLFGAELGPALFDFVKCSTHMVGCVAWVTNTELLKLMGRRRVSLCIQNERGVMNNGKGKLLRDLSNDWTRDMFTGPIALSSRRFEKTGIPPLSLTGRATRSRTNMALMHHKFAIRLSLKDGVLVPNSVWTGSMNWSHNGTEASLENALIINDPLIARTYMDEFEHVMLLSRPPRSTA